MALTAQQVGMLALLVNSGGSLTKEFHGSDVKVLQNLRKKGAISLRREVIPMSDSDRQHHFLVTGRTPKTRYRHTATVLDGAPPLV